MRAWRPRLALAGVVLLAATVAGLTMYRRTAAIPDVRAVAVAWQGGGHRNAAGCTIRGRYEDAKPALVAALIAAVDATS